jgi:antitoxin MazE
MEPTTAVAKWGNALAIRIPKSVVEQAHLCEGDAVQFKVEDPGVISVVRVNRAEPTLDDLLASVIPQNRHEETDWGPRRGKEVW